MDWTTFVSYVSVPRLSALGIGLAIYIVLGLAGAIKAGDFKWSKIAEFLKPGANFLGWILGYVAIAFIAAAVDKAWEPAVIASYIFVIGAMLAKFKEQLAYLGLPLANLRLPLEKTDAAE